jgi:RNA polymerase sigma factor (sigma-70 family)
MPADVADHDLRLVVRQAVQDLPARDRLIITLRYYGDLRCTDIASALGLTLPAVHMALSRARSSLRETLAA